MRSFHFPGRSTVHARNAMVATTTRISTNVNAARENRSNLNLIPHLDRGKVSKVTRKMDKLYRTCF